MRFRQSAIGIALATATVACAPTARSSHSAVAEISFSPRADPAFGDATPAIERLLADTASPSKGVQHFCAIGYRGAEGAVAWVHWREAGRLILWLGKGDGSAAADALVHSNRDLDLNTDVVATESDLAGSTYRVTRAWVATKLEECAQKGDQYAISAS